MLLSGREVYISGWDQVPGPETLFSLFVWKDSWEAKERKRMRLHPVDATASREGTKQESPNLGAQERRGPLRQEASCETPEKVGGATGSPESKRTSANGKDETMRLVEFSKEQHRRFCSDKLVQVSKAPCPALCPSWWAGQKRSHHRCPWWQ